MPTIQFRSLIIRIGFAISLLGTAPAQASQYEFTTFAGRAGGWGSEDGPRDSARFKEPQGIARDSAGNLYVADTGNHVIRKIATDGTVSTLAGTAGASGSSDGIGAAARFLSPAAIAVDAGNTIYVADTGNSTIRKIAANGTVTTFAGSPGLTGTTNGTGGTARFAAPGGLAVSSSGEIFVADTGNHAMRKVTAAGVVTTFAGTAGTSGFVDNTGTSARFNAPAGLAFDTSGILYVCDRDNNRIRKLTSAAVVTTLAGGSSLSGSSDGTGTAARFYNPAGIALDPSGHLLVTDKTNYTIRKVTTAGVVTTIAGTARSVGFQDGTGPIARFNKPSAIVLDSSGTAFIADTANQAIRSVSTTAAVTTYAGRYDYGNADGNGADARFWKPKGTAVDGAGNIYVADSTNRTIRKITATGQVSTIAGLAGGSGFYVDGNGSAARFYDPRGIALDGSGNVLVAESNGIRKITSAGEVTTFGERSSAYNPVGLAFDSSGNLFVTDVGAAGRTIYKITQGGQRTTFLSPSALVLPNPFTPSGLAIDSANNLYVVETANHLILRISPSGTVTTLAGTVGVSGSADGLGTSARFNFYHGSDGTMFTGIAVDAAGNVFVSDSQNQTIRQISPAGQVTTVGGTAGQAGILDGIDQVARFHNPSGLALDAQGNLIVATGGSHTIRRGSPILEVPVITNVTSASGQVGVPFSYQINASESPTAYSASGLPDGLVCNVNTGFISGTPLLSGAFGVALSAQNSAGIGTAELQLIIAPIAMNYTVTFNPGTHGSRTGGGALIQDVEQGNSALEPIITADVGWTFSGWDAASANVTSNLTVTALYSPVIYTMTFVVGTNGTRSGGGELMQTIAHGDPATAPIVLANTGWIFTGWDTAFLSVTSDLEITAIYLAAPIYNVTFSLGPNGYGTRIGGGELAQAVVHGESATPPTVAAVSGQRFIGWDLALSNITGNILITAVYQAYAVSTVTFDLGLYGSRTGGGALIQIIEHGYAALAPIVTAEANWVFVGWDLPFNAISSNLNITALYAPASNVVTFDPGTQGARSGGGALSQNVVYLGAAEPPLITASLGWSFVGWDLPFDSITGNMQIRAIYEATAYTDSFDPVANSSLWALFEGEVAANTYGQAAGTGSSGNSLWFNGNNTRSATTVPLDTTGSSIIRFKIALGNSSAPWEDVNIGEGEEIVIEYSIDGVTFTSLGGPFVNKTWQEFTLPLLQVAKTAHTRFRFRQLGHSGSSFDNWAIEDLFIDHSQPAGENKAPTALASASVVNAAIGAVDLTGSLSIDSDGSISSYAWIWSGGSATGISPSVTLSGGTTVITLTVTDNQGATGTATVTVHVNDTGHILSQAGLSGSAAALDATPFNDGVPNLLKYAFNMNAAGPDVSVLTSSGSSGLPQITVDSSGAEPVLKVAFLRRKGSGLIYTPQRSDTLGIFFAMTGNQTVTSIDTQWERVIVEDSAPPATLSSAFARVEVSLP